MPRRRGENVDEKLIIAATEKEAGPEKKSQPETSVEVGEYKFELKIIKPDCITPEFPNGFGLELSLQHNNEDVNFEDFIGEQKMWILEKVQTYGVIILTGC